MNSGKKAQKCWVSGILVALLALFSFWFVGEYEQVWRGPSSESETVITERVEPGTGKVSRSEEAVEATIHSDRKADVPEDAASDEPDEAGQASSSDASVEGTGDDTEANRTDGAAGGDGWFAELQAFPLVNELIEQGATRPDFELARERMLAAGFSEAHTLDLNQLLAVLPRRNVRAVMIDDIELPARGLAGQEVAFTVRGTFPDASYAFDRWDITRAGDEVVVVPIGRTSGEQVPALIVPVEEEGRLPGMDAGTYAVHFKGLGAEASRSLIIE